MPLFGPVSNGAYQVAHRFPVIGALVERVEIEPGVARRMRQRRDDGIQIRLAGLPAHGGDGGIGRMHAGVGRFQDRGRIDAAGIVRVEVNRDADLVAQRLAPAPPRRKGCSSPAMSLMARMCAPIFSSSFAMRT